MRGTRTADGSEIYRRFASTPGRLSTDCACLDKLLRGGFLVPGISEVAGTSAAGKTQLCLQLCLTAQLPREKGGLHGSKCTHTLSCKLILVNCLHTSLCRALGKGGGGAGISFALPLLSPKLPLVLAMLPQ